VGLCPFHEERTPSFSVNPDRGLFYCFGCRTGGDVIDFVMRLEGLSFPEAVERLARRFGVELPPRSPGAARRRRAGERIRAVLEEAQTWFEARLAGPEGAAARRELERRGFGRETWARFGFGYAPDDWRALVTALGRRHPVGLLVAAGLAVEPERGGSPYDRFRHRVTFPIRAGDGRLLAFGGRALGDAEPKYLNSPENELFHKRSVLFLLDRARRAIADAGEAVVVEGYFDALSLHRVGMERAVATLGTALTREHARALRRLASRVLLCYDADAAGRRAAAAGARALLEAGLQVAVVVLEAGTDPDDLVRSGGAEAFRARLERPQPLIEFLLAELPEDRAARRNAAGELAELVGAARDPAVRFALQEELARRLDLPVEVVTELADRRRRRAPAPASPPGPASADPGELALVRLLLEAPPEVRRLAVETIRPELLGGGPVVTLVRTLRTLGAEATAEDDPVARVLAATDDAEVRQLVARVTAADLPPLPEAAARAQLTQVLKRQVQELGRRITRAIEAAGERGDAGELEQLLAEKTRLLERLARLGD